MIERKGPDTRPQDGSGSESYSDSVRYSRAGDRFHHVWAAVQSLKLLDSRSGLQTVWIEGAPGDPVGGDEIIDVAEFYGPAVDSINEVVVRQLKYSVTRADRVLGVGELGETLRKFAQIDSRAGDVLQVPPDSAVRYVVLSNRPVWATFQRAVEAVAAGLPVRARSTGAKVLNALGLDPVSAAELCSRIEFASDRPRLEALRRELDRSTTVLTGEFTAGTAALLIESVSRRASGEVSGPIDLDTVTTAFEVTRSELLPAPSMLADKGDAFQRDSYKGIASAVLKSSGPIVVTAVGGAGKSTFAASLPRLLGQHATVVVYDCFGNGSYRAPETPRHHHAEGFVQIVSELMGSRLCGPLIPSATTSPTSYVKAFASRLRTAANNLEIDHKLVIVVDAADNAAMAADLRPGDLSFARDLLRMAPIAGVQIVLTARPERLELLDPPPGVAQYSIPEFSLPESSTMLRTVFPKATDAEAQEFHRRTAGNPRLQALALEGRQSILECLGALSDAPGNTGDALEAYLNLRLDEILDESSEADKRALDLLGRLLARLRPRIPILVLSQLIDRDAAFIKSFASDLRRGLLVDDDAVQFLDEPTETFFRNRYPLVPDTADRLVDLLTTLAESSSYAATTLPQVLWESGRHSELLELARTKVALPTANEVQHRQIAHLRMEFALRAAIQIRRPGDIVALSMRAGAAASSTDRRYELLRNEPDLAGDVLPSDLIDELRAAHVLPREWPGSTLSAEAVMLATRSDRRGDAQSVTRAAQKAIHAWVSLPRNAGDRREQIQPRHLADAVVATALLSGPEAGARYLESWRPDRWLVENSVRVARTLIGRAESDLLDSLGAESATAAVSVGLAAELQRIGRPLSVKFAESAWASVRKGKIKVDLDNFAFGDTADAVYRGLTWIVAAAVRNGLVTARKATALLARYLPAQPPYGLGDPLGTARTGLMFAYAMRGELAGSPISVTDLQPPPKTDTRTESRNDSAKASLERMTPWLAQWALWALGAASTETTRALLKSYPARRTESYDSIRWRRVAGPIAIQLARGSSDPEIVDAASALLRSAASHSGFYVATDMLAVCQGDPALAEATYACASDAADGVERETQSAEETADDLVRIARAIYAYDKAEATAYFERAVAIVSRIGHDAWHQWRSVLAIASVAEAESDQASYLLAAQLGRTAEAIYPYLDDSFVEAELVHATRHLAGPRVLALLSLWRDRGFCSLPGTVAAVVEGGTLFRDAPHLAVSLAPFSDRIDVARLLGTAIVEGRIDDRQRRVLQALEWARGRDPVLEQTAEDSESEVTSRARPVNSDVDRDATTDSESRAPDRLRALDLTTREGMAGASAEFSGRRSRTDMITLLDEMTRRPIFEWSAIVTAFGDSEAFTDWQSLEFLKGAVALPTTSQSFASARRALAETLLARQATDIVSGYSSGEVASVLASVLDLPVDEVMMRALTQVDANTVVGSGEACYRLASNVATLMTPDEAAAALRESLRELEIALEIDEWVDGLAPAASPCELRPSLARFLWSALGDPRAAVRWNAIHAVRFTLQFGDITMATDLSDVARAGMATGYVDERFPFYLMHAIDGFLFAAERAAIAEPANVAPVLPLLEAVQQSYPEHMRFQRGCAEIARLLEKGTGDSQAAKLATKAHVNLQPSAAVPRWERPNVPKPFEHGAPESEFDFHFDLDEFWIGELTSCFDVEHAEVLNMMSEVILTDWGWRDSPHLSADPRREAGVFGPEDTYFHKSDFPKSEDLHYYLSYHAMLTVAGRLARERTPFQEPDENEASFEEWMRSFDLGRADRLWMADARRPLPIALGHRLPDTQAGWQWEVGWRDLVAAFLQGTGWVTVSQSARWDSYHSSERIVVDSALVDAKTAPALVRALQTAPSFFNHRLPDTDDEDYTFDVGDFRLSGWLDGPSSSRGIDSRDPFAREISYPTARPSPWIVERFGLGPRDSGLNWSDSEQSIVARSEAWAWKEGERDPHGPDGSRLLISTEFVDRLVRETGKTLILEVRIDRNDESTRSSNFRGPDGSLGYIDDYTAFFIYTADFGWCDYRGRPVAGQTDR